MASLDDEKAVLALIEELFEAPGAFPAGYTPDRGREGFRYAVQRPDADVLLAEADGEVVGLASVYLDAPFIRFGRRCWLQDLVVTASRRGEGTGAALLGAAADWARQRRCTHLELGSGAGRADAHRFYRAQGMAGSMLFTRWIEV